MSYEAVAAPASAPSKLTRYMDYEPPVPASGNSMPVYPPELVELALPEQEIVVRIIIAESGQVAEIQPSQVSSRVDSAFRLAFDTAVTDAVKTWRFSPATYKRFEDGPDSDKDGKPDYPVLKAEELSRSYLDIRFRFVMRDGKALTEAIK